MRGVVEGALRPVAGLLLRLGLSPSAVTVLGTVGAVASALALLPAGRWVLGASLVALFLLGDGLDGTMARASGRVSRFGAFLDSTLDRLADAAVFVALAWGCARVDDGLGAGLALAALVAGFMVSYARARAEAEGWDASVGILERADRLVVTLLGVLAVGLGAPAWVLWAALGVVALGSGATIVQRVAAAHRASADG